MTTIAVQSIAAQERARLAQVSTWAKFGCSGQRRLDSTSSTIPIHAPPGTPTLYGGDHLKRTADTQSAHAR
jgi:hypothetical protein